MPKRRDTAFLCAFVLALTTRASLAATPDPLATIRQCAAESDDTRRLACYDKQFRVLDAYTATPVQPRATAAAQSTAAQPATVPGATPPVPPAGSAEQRFGMNGQVERSNPTTQAPKIDHLAGRIAAVSYKPRGEAIIKLDNGQVWEEADGEDPVNLKVGDSVTVDTGVMGAYWLRFGKHGSVRVKRTH